MNGIIEWYSAFSSTEQVFWACAIIGSVIFLIQLVFTLIGMDASDVEVDFDGANTLDMGGGMSLFSVRALVNFLVGFGWAGVSLRSAISSDIVLYVVSFAVGLFFAWLVRALMNKLRICAFLQRERDMARYRLAYEALCMNFLLSRMARSCVQEQW